MAQRLTIIRNPGLRYLTRAESPHGIRDQPYSQTQTRGYNGTQKFNEVMAKSMSSGRQTTSLTNQTGISSQSSAPTSNGPPAQGGNHLHRNNTIKFHNMMAKGISGRGFHTSRPTANLSSERFHKTVTQSMSGNRLRLEETVGSTYNGTVNFNLSILEGMKSQRRLTDDANLAKNRSEAFHASVMSGMSRPLRTFFTDDMALTFQQTNRNEAFNASVMLGMSRPGVRQSQDDMSLTLTPSNRTEAFNIATMSGISNARRTLPAHQPYTNRSQVFNTCVISGISRPQTNPAISIPNRSEALNDSIVQGLGGFRQSEAAMKPTRCEAFNSSLINGMTAQKVPAEAISKMWQKPISIDYAEKPRVEQFNAMMSAAMSARRTPSTAGVSAN